MVCSVWSDDEICHKVSLPIADRIECPFVSVFFLSDNSDSDEQNRTFYNEDNAIAESASYSRLPANCIT